MRFNGEWVESYDGETRPMVRCAVVGPRGETEPCMFLIDSGADRSLITFEVSRLVGAEVSPLDFAVRGLGATVNSAQVNVNLMLERDDGVEVLMRGPLIACMEPGLVDTCILGRDVLTHFCVILDEKNNLAALLAGTHRCRIEQS